MTYGPDAPVNFGPANRVVLRTVLNWANGLPGRPGGAAIQHLIKMLTENVESDRAHFATARKLPDRDTLKTLIRAELVDQQSCYMSGSRWTKDVLELGCEAAGYKRNPVSPAEAADKFAEFVADAILNLLAAPVPSTR